jgi:membrane-associated protein
MEFIRGLIDLFLHFDVHLAAFVAQYGALVYGLLFAIVFAETGLVVTPFLPGDSLLFAAGALAATGALDLRLVVLLLLVAAIAGDAVNYSTGRYLGPRVFSRDARDGFVQRALNREHLDRAHAFFEHHGGKAIVLARFVPIIRTFVPFVAGAGAMRYQTFAFYNVTGALLWVLGCVGAGYVFGNVPIVKDNFSLVVLGIIAVSLIPVLTEWLRHKKKGQRGEPLP